MQWLPFNAWQVIYILWRWIMALYFFAWLVVSGVDWNHPTYFIYLTNWGMLTWVLYLVVSAVSCTVSFAYDMYTRIKGVNTDVETTDSKDTENGNTAADGDNVDIYANWRIDNVHWYQKIHWIVFNISLPLEIGIAILYWALLYDPTVVVSPTASGVNFNTHLLPAVIALADVCISGIVLNIYHIYMIFLYTVVYAVFTLIYFGAGGMDQFGNRYIYAFIDYGGRPGLAAGILLACVFVYFPFLYLLLYLISLPRRWLSSKFHQSCYKE